jgi:hypothetical protein
VAASPNLPITDLDKFDELTWSVRRIALSGTDPSHPKFGEALEPLSRKLRSMLLAIMNAKTLRASDLRTAFDELEALVVKYRAADEA